MESHVTESLKSSAQRSYDDKLTYEEKIEKATGIDVFKYVLLINVSALEGYVHNLDCKHNKTSA